MEHKENIEEIKTSKFEKHPQVLNTERSVFT